MSLYRNQQPQRFVVIDLRDGKVYGPFADIGYAVTWITRKPTKERHHFATRELIPPLK